MRHKFFQCAPRSIFICLAILVLSSGARAQSDAAKIYQKNYGASAMVIVLLLHLSQTYIYGAYKGRPTKIRTSLNRNRSSSTLARS